MQSHALSNASITPFCGIAQSTTSKFILDAFRPSQFRLVTSFLHVSALVWNPSRSASFVAPISLLCVGKRIRISSALLLDTFTGDDMAYRTYGCFWLGLLEESLGCWDKFRFPAPLAPQLKSSFIKVVRSQRRLRRNTGLINVNQPWWLDRAVLGKWLSYLRLADTWIQLLRVSAKRNYSLAVL